MTPRKLNIMFAFFPYTGNSTGKAVAFELLPWWGETLLKMKTDGAFKDRIGRISLWDKADTPITMTRNLAVAVAKQQNVDVLVMVDSDIHPDVHLGLDPDAVPFFDTAFNAIYEHWDQGPIVIGAPYGGCPPHENMFVFDWTATGNIGEESPFKMRQYERQEAQQMSGIQECAALPTGLIMYDVRCFDLMGKPYFYYDWKDASQSEKSSTEDVANTRDISLAGLMKHGYNPVRCAWSCWAGHKKVWTVGKPMKYTASHVAKTLREAILRDMQGDEKIVDAETVLKTVGKGLTLATLDSAAGQSLFHAKGK